MSDDDVHVNTPGVRPAAGIDRKPYGLLAEGDDDQGVHVQLWQPPA